MIKLNWMVQLTHQANDILKAINLDALKCFELNYFANSYIWVTGIDSNDEVNIEVANIH